MIRMGAGSILNVPGAIRTGAPAEMALDGKNGADVDIGRLDARCHWLSDHLCDPPAPILAMFLRAFQFQTIPRHWPKPTTNKTSLIYELIKRNYQNE